MFSWKDGIATLLVVAAVLVLAAYAGAWSLPLVADARVATLAIGAIGFAGCVAGGSSMKAFKGPYVTFMSALGVIAFAVLVIGLITGWALAPWLLAADLVALWIVGTAHHALSGPPVPQHI